MMSTNYIAAQNAKQRENDITDQLNTIYPCAMMVTSQCVKTSCFVWHYFWREKKGPILFEQTWYTGYLSFPFY